MVAEESSSGSSKVGGSKSSRGEDPPAKKQRKRQGNVYDDKIYGRIKDKECTLRTAQLQKMARESMVGQGIVRLHAGKDLPLPLATLDRIDPNDGYHAYNVRFSLLGLNNLRNDARDEVPLIKYHASMKSQPAVPAGTRLPRANWLNEEDVFDSVKNPYMTSLRVVAPAGAPKLLLLSRCRLLSVPPLYSPSIDRVTFCWLP